ncbi:hypothetical protein MHYP_G00241710 [Metynnis hypsauchen]
MHDKETQRELRNRKAWDAAKEVPIIQDEQKVRKSLSIIQFVTCSFVGILVFALAFFSKVVLVESLVALGSAVLTLVCMPNFDILTNVMLLSGIATSSAVLQVVANMVARGRRRFIGTSAASVVLLIAGFTFFALNYLKEGSRKEEMKLFVGLAIGSTFLVSLSWWENYAMLFKITFFNNTIRDIKKSRNLVGIVSSIARIAVISIVLGAYVKLSGQDWELVLSVTSSTKIVVLSLFAIQILSSALCRWVAVVACKMHAVRRSFVLPLIFVSPAALAAFVLAIWIPYREFKPIVPFNGTFAEYCGVFVNVSGPGLDIMKQMVTDLTLEVCNQTVYSEGSVEGYALLGSSLVSWWLGLVLCTLYIWYLGTHRIERTKDLFVRSLYEAAFIDQSMLLNTRFEVVYQSRLSSKEKEKMTIYLCATMWHETYDEMMKMIISMFRLDKFRPKKNQFNDVAFESHIYFDDAFKKKDNERRVNEYAETLAEVIKEVYILFSEEGTSSFRERNPLPDQKLIQTPYGCRLQYTLPQGNTLIVHFKDKHRIRHKKRWSQIMYLYFLLGWRLNRPHFQMYEEGEEELTSIEERLKKAKQNTYILALDGDTDFQPSAVMLLVDRLRMYPEVGAACGRIHPTGTGPMVWYQKFEYAVGHWLQKTAEHVFGCVLCSPGCFSLFRAAALMDDNVMKRYTTKPTEASHYVQYDQGEDRWLCTLLLQQGWRVEYNAASDSYTNAPQEFKEFYNQRRRWGPSTMANTLDLLSSGGLTAQKNKSISRPYILYQTITMAASILGPATVCLMIAGSFKFILKIDANSALVLAVVPPVIYMIICFYTKSDTQITIAAILSIFYAFQMTATLLSIIADMVLQDTFMTPSGLFFIGIVAMYIFTALLHPHEFQLIIYGLLYVVCIPSGYLLLIIYSMVNMNNVSWGTRETGAQAAMPTENQKNVKCQKLLKVCGYSLEFQVSQDVKVVSAVPQNNVLQVTAGSAPEAAVPEVPTQQEEKGTPVIQECFIRQLKESSGELPLQVFSLNEVQDGQVFTAVPDLQKVSGFDADPRRAVQPVFTEEPYRQAVLLASADVYCGDPQPAGIPQVSVKCTFKSYVAPNMKTMAIIVFRLPSGALDDHLSHLLPDSGAHGLHPAGRRLLRASCRLTSWTRMKTVTCTVGIAIFTSLLISLNWWENSLQASNNIQEMLSKLDGSRDFMYLFTSMLRIAVTIGIYFLYYGLITSPRIDFAAFSHIKADCPSDRPRPVLPASLLLSRLPLVRSGGLQDPRAGNLDVGTHIIYANYTPIDNPFLDFCAGLKKLQNSNTTSVVLLELSNSICRTSLNSHYALWPFSMLVLEGFCMWLGLIACTYYVWSMKVPRIERTSQLFVRRLYESAFINQSLLLNIKMKVKYPDSIDEAENCVIYLCATMWHETYDEMLKILTSMFRLDRYRGDPKHEHQNAFDFECHIYVDDAFMTDDETGKRLVNSYVNDLIHVVTEVYRVFTNKEPDEVSIIETPYGGRLMFVLPEGNMLYIHLKDKLLIRNKKRWSQRQNNPCRASLVSLDGQAYLLPNYDNDSKRKYISDENTYILALDGDTDFHPSAVILLVDRLRMYANVGAACGRIHPTGMGPMVWYQKFEYAVGHWLQKTAEHVFGCVLCSPGCFSLFRGSALMDDNVLKRYTTKSTRASEYVQYDQGEDRWLCTLLLQQGWRVEYNAASDAFTNAPQEFKEFYNQRRRWGPSTLANTLDLLHSGGETVKRNTSISMLYIFYQIFTVASSILGPASVTLMVAGAFQFVLSLSGTMSIIIAVIPPIAYMLICFLTKTNFQLTLASILSVLYAFLMTAAFFAIIGDMIKEETFITPTGIFLISMTVLYLITAILHPMECTLIIYGLMYFICIPSGYLLLTIYSLVNMNNVSWGTRESNKDKAEKKHKGVLCDRNCKLCCWDVSIQVTQETENLMLQQIQQAVSSNAPAAQTEMKEMTTQESQERSENDKHENNKNVAKNTEDTKKPLSKYKDLDSDSEKSFSEGESSIERKDIIDDEDDSDSDNFTYEDQEEEEEEKEVVPERDWVRPVKDEFLKKLTYANLKRNLQEQIKYTLRNKNEEDLCEELVQMLTDTVNEELKDKVGPEDILSDSQLEELQDALNESARRILKTNRKKRLEARVKRAVERTLVAPQVEKLSEDENDFWKKLIERYLEPINDPKGHKEEVERELKSLRNKAVFLYFIVNVLWVVATFILEAIGSDLITIKIPKYLPNGTLSDEPLKVEPLSLMFLLSFAILLLVQFLAMLYHRVYTLIHVLAYRGSEKDYKENDEDDETMILENQLADGVVISGEDF